MACNEIMNNNNNKTLAQHLDHHDHDHDHHDDVDALSFCDLLMDNDENEDLPTSEDDQYYDDDQEEDRDHHDHHDQDLFEFLSNPEAEPTRADKIIFCGKTITLRKQSFKKCHSSSGASRSVSFRLFGGLGGPTRAGLPAESGGYSRSGSGTGRNNKQKVFIGLVMRFDAPKMELSEIRKRQGRRSPVPLFPATGRAGGREGGPTATCRSRHCHHNWGLLLRPLWCKAHFAFGCISQ